MYTTMNGQMSRWMVQPCEFQKVESDGDKSPMVIGLALMTVMTGCVFILSEHLKLLFYLTIKDFLVVETKGFGIRISARKACQFGEGCF